MRPDYFIGRVAELRQLLEGLTAAGGDALAVVQPHVVPGGGGIGKTRLAVQALWVLYLQRKCDMAFFVSAASPDELDTQLAALSGAGFLDLYKDQEPPRELEARKQHVIVALHKNSGRWILLLDSADSVEARDAVNRLLRELAGGRFIVTSRRDDWPAGTVRTLPLVLFSPEEARACLRSRYWKPNPSEQELAGFDAVARELGFLPLALALAAGYMNHRRIGPEAYLRDWKEKHDALLAFRDVTLDYDRSLLAAFELSYRQLSEPARALLELLAWLAPEPFPRSLIERIQIVPKKSSDADKEPAAADVAALLDELRTLSLIQLDEDTLRCHKLVLECTRALIPAASRSSNLAAAFGWMRSVLPKTAFDPAGWRLWTSLAPHLDAAIGLSEPFGFEDSALASICSDYGVWLHNQARFRTAEPLMKRALAIDEKSYGAEHPTVAIRLNNLAALLRITNRVTEAEPLVKRALAIDEKSYGAEHPTVAIRFSNLAQLFQDTNRLAEAEPLMRRALAIAEKSYGPEHPDVAIRLNNLALLLRDTNRLAEAEPLMKRALAINEKSYGPEHPEVATILNNLAQLLQDTNRLAEAEPLMKRALAIDEKSYGPEHPTVATDINNLATLLRDTNRLAEAEPLMKRALAIDEKSYGPEHPTVAILLNNLAALLRDTNRLAEAEPLMKRALAIDEKSYGPEHPAVARDLNNLAQLLKATDRLAEAETLMKRHLVILMKFTHSTGHLHPDLRDAFVNYLGLLGAMAVTKDETGKRLAEAGREAGFDEDAFRKLMDKLRG